MGLKKNTPNVNQMLNQGRFGQGDEQVFDDYYKQFVLPQWTRVKDIANLPELRHDLGNQLRKKSRRHPPPFTTI